MLLLLLRWLIGCWQVLMSRLLVGQVRQRLAGHVLLLHPLAVVHLLRCLLISGIKVPQVEVILAPAAALVVIEMHLPTVLGAGPFCFSHPRRLVPASAGPPTSRESRTAAERLGEDVQEEEGKAAEEGGSGRGGLTCPWPWPRTACWPCWDG